ncbi:hypothetical protein COU37_05460 [Candidatus Micrarchaeota archaeon CG10_big_fil_rev_8_21_14_0_10_45_29]|nr:MAG: hypothetical protein COU37_05460 [Candidatus Micrarchaeota archaeon CG10_big_fil_rev_8_21_14_0_10_45_29]
MFKEEKQPKTFQYYKNELIRQAKNNEWASQENLNGLISACRQNPKNAFEGSKIILNFLYPGILTNKSLEVIDAEPKNFFEYYDHAYKATEKSVSARQNFISLLNSIPSRFDASYQYAQEGKDICSFSNQHLAVVALGDYAREGKGNLQEILGLLENGSRISEPQLFSYVREDLLTLLQSSKLNDAKLSLQALESLDYSQHATELQNVRNSILTMLDEESLPQQIHKLADRSKLLPPKFERMMDKAQKKLDGALAHTSDLDEAKQQLLFLLEYLKANPAFTRTPGEGGQTPAKRVYELIERAASVLQGTYRDTDMSDEEREFIEEFVPKAQNELKEADKSLLRAPAIEQDKTKKGGASDFNIMDEPEEVGEDVVLTKDEDMLRRISIDDYFSKLRDSDKPSFEWATKFNFEPSAVDPYLQWDEIEQKSALDYYWDKVYGLGQADPSKKKQMQNEAANSQYKEILRARLSKIMPNFSQYEKYLDSGEWDKLEAYLPKNSGIIPVPENLSDGILRTKKRTEIAMQRLPISFKFNFYDSNLWPFIENAWANKETLIMCGVAFPGTEGMAGKGGLGFKTTFGFMKLQEKGVHITDYQGFYAPSTISGVLNTLRSAKASQASLNEVEQIISGRVNVMTLSRVAKALGYNYINGNLQPDLSGSQEVNINIMQNTIDILKSELYHSQDVKRIDSPEKLTFDAIFDMPWYFVFGSPYLTFMARPYAGVGTFVSAKTDAKTGEISPETNFGITQYGLRLSYGDNIFARLGGAASRTLTKIDGSAILDIDMNRDVEGKWIKPRFDFRATASPSAITPKAWSESSWSAWLVDSKLELGIEAGGQMEKPAGTLGIWLFPDMYWVKELPELHMSASLRADPFNMQLRSWHLKTGYDVKVSDTQFINIFTTMDWKKIEKIGNSPVITLGLDFKF